MTTRPIKGRVLPGSPKTQALLFRVWQFAHPREWDVTTHDIANALNVSTQAVANAMARAKWTHRIRSSRPADTSHSLSLTGSLQRQEKDIAAELRADLSWQVCI